MKKIFGMLSMAMLLMVIGGVPARAAHLSQERTSAKSAEANILTNVGCEDWSVGVNVTEKTNLLDKKAAPIRTASVFGSFVDTCEFGTSTSFFGTTTVENSAFTQDGVQSAMLNKTFTIDGHALRITLTWTGKGVIGGEDFKTNDKSDGVHLHKIQNADSRNALISGIFEVDGLNRIQGNSLINAELDTVQNDSKTLIK